MTLRKFYNLNNFVFSSEKWEIFNLLILSFRGLDEMCKFKKFHRRKKFNELREIFAWNLNTRCLSLNAITHYHKLGSLNNKHLLLTVLEARNSRIEVPADLVYDESHFLVCRWPSFPFILTWWRAERERAHIHFTSYKDPIRKGSILMI